MTVSATVKPRMYLHFLDLDPLATGKPEQLQIGHCYMPGLAEPKGKYQPPGLPSSGRGDANLESEIVRPLRVRNVSDRKLYLTCTPNLKKQCFVYAEIPLDGTSSDPTATAAANNQGRGLLGESERGCRGVSDSGVNVSGAGNDRSAVTAAAMPRPQVADLLLLPQSETTLYIGLRPVLPNEAYTSGYVCVYGVSLSSVVLNYFSHRAKAVPVAFAVVSNLTLLMMWHFSAFVTWDHPNCILRIL